LNRLIIAKKRMQTIKSCSYVKSVNRRHTQAKLVVGCILINVLKRKKKQEKLDKLDYLYKICNQMSSQIDMRSRWRKQGDNFNNKRMFVLLVSGETFRVWIQDYPRVQVSLFIWRINRILS